MNRHEDSRINNQSKGVHSNVYCDDGPDETTTSSNTMTEAMDEFDIEAGVPTTIATNNDNSSTSSSSDELSNTARIKSRTSWHASDNTVASSAASTITASSVVLASDMDILEAKAVIAASLRNGTSVLSREELSTRVFRFTGVPSVTKSIENANFVQSGAHPMEHSDDETNERRDGKVVPMSSSGVTPQSIVQVKESIVAARVERQRRATALEMNETFRRRKQELVDHATANTDPSSSSTTAALHVAEMSEEQFVMLATAKLVIEGDDVRDVERARVMEEARRNFLAETTHAEPVEWSYVVTPDKQSHRRDISFWHWIAFGVVVTIVTAIVSVVLVVLCKSPDGNKVGDNAHQTITPTVTETTDSPSMAPLVHSPNGKRAFTQTSQLYSAVDDYLLALESEEDMETSVVATTYGYPMGTWDVSRLSDFSRVFDPDRTQRLDANRRSSRPSQFDEDLSGWNVSNAITMSGAFAGASQFSGKGLEKWNVAKVTDFSFLFASAVLFTSDLSDWNTSNAIRMDSMFQDAMLFESDLSQWDVSKLESASYMFASAENFVGGNLHGWIVSRVTNMASMFSHARKFVGGVSTWDTSRVTTMSEMFSNADLFNDDLSSWSMGSLIYMSQMFREAINFAGGDLTSWDTGKVSHMDATFAGALAFVGNVSSWNVSRVIHFPNTFLDCPLFDSDLSNWNTSSAEVTYGMFHYARLFSSDLSLWDTRNLKDAGLMFAEADLFNSDISRWDVSNLILANEMFVSADRFNQSLCLWRARLPETVDTKEEQLQYPLEELQLAFPPFSFHHTSGAMTHYEPPMVVAQPYYPPVTGAPTVLPQYQYTAPPPSQQNTFTKRVEHTKVSFVRDRRGPCYWMLNILWILLAGWHFFLAWFLAGIILCCTIVMIPCGCQVLKISWFLLFPFGQSIESSQRYGQCGGCNCCLNALWMLTVGWILSLQALMTGFILCCTIVGIPFGWQCFKLAILCFCPFGLELSTLEVVETTTTVTMYNH